MRNITKNAYAKFKLQSEEALVQSRTAETDGGRKKMLKIASALKEQIDSAKIREDNSGYIYTNAQLAHDVEDVFWKAAIRVSDYFDTTLDGLETNEVIERYAEQFIDEMRMKLGNTHGVGAYEPGVPGEDEDTYVSIEVSDS